ncbi:MAG: ECF-type riboflavin transporter substrate-binding protein [Spirochaetaceae bacterium]|jgi:energy-coupling factor transport system substrate-specific component|nr:ECF-type riboflavin transporter substrate-binding protein [Spirochaetaceae bacterium]
MAKENYGRIILGKWNTRTLVAVAVGAALFGVLMVYGSIPVFTNTQLTSAMIIPVVVGGLFGPLPAFVTLLIGNILADTIGGWGYWFDWSIGNGILGLFVGTLPLYGARIDEGVFKVQHAVIYAVVAIVGNAIAFGLVTPLLTSLFYAADLEITFLQAFASGLSNTLVLIVVGIPILILLSRRFGKRKDLKEEE